MTGIRDNQVRSGFNERIGRWLIRFRSAHSITMMLLSTAYTSCAIPNASAAALRILSELNFSNFSSHTYGGCDFV
eukprot:29122-Pelagococcus_subviridis.AAC.5